MNVRNYLFAVLGTLALPALANSGFTDVGGEAGATTHAMPAALTRAQVQQELAAWKRNPVTADGWREVGGEVGWVFVGGAEGRSPVAWLKAARATSSPPLQDRLREIGRSHGPESHGHR